MRKDRKSMCRKRRRRNTKGKCRRKRRKKTLTEEGLKKMCQER